MNSVRRPRLDPADLGRLRTFRLLPNLSKIPLVLGLMFALGWLAWHTDSAWIRWTAYLGLGYLWMSVVTFMHDATHNTLFKRRWLGWAFGIIAMLPLFASFVAFKEDHIEHHRHTRSPRDPDAFPMGQRRLVDFLLFYGYMVAGALLSFLHFNLIYPLQRFGVREWSIHLGETALKVLLYWQLIAWAQANGVLGKTLELWLIPIFIFSLLNSMRFIAEHYGTPWDQGQMLGTRTVISNPVNAFCWNNINLHIGHHLYPGVPWYNLQELHELLKDDIAREGAIVDKSYIAVFLDALRGGPETEARLQQSLAARKA